MSQWYDKASTLTLGLYENTVVIILTLVSKLNTKMMRLRLYLFLMLLIKAYNLPLSSIRSNRLCCCKISTNNFDKSGSISNQRIMSEKNDKVKLIKSLDDAKSRSKTGLIKLEG